MLQNTALFRFTACLWLLFLCSSLVARRHSCVHWQYYTVTAHRTFTVFWSKLWRDYFWMEFSKKSFKTRQTVPFLVWHWILSNVYLLVVGGFCVCERLISADNKTDMENYAICARKPRWVKCKNLFCREKSVSTHSFELFLNKTILNFLTFFYKNWHQGVS